MHCGGQRNHQPIRFTKVGSSQGIGWNLLLAELALRCNDHCRSQLLSFRLLRGSKPYFAAFGGGDRPGDLSHFVQIGMVTFVFAAVVDFELQYTRLPKCVAYER